MSDGGGAAVTAGGAGVIAWECVVFTVFVCATTCAPLFTRRRGKVKADAGGGAGGVGVAEGGGGGGGGGGGKLAYVFAGGAGGVSTAVMILSVARGTLGVRSFLGFPSELVYRGAAMWETLYGMCLAFPLVGWVLVPLYWRLRTTSVYEYLQLRFGSAAVRRLAAGTFVLRQVLNLAVTVYTPSVALHAALGLPHWVTAAALAAAAALFTLLGGLAAAIRADVIQTVTMVVVSCAFIVQATVSAGGPARVLRANVQGGRLDFFNFTWDPRTRVDTLSAVVGQVFMSVSIYGCQQTFVQRYCSMASARAARRTLWGCAPAVAVLFSLSWLVGCALYALYAHCDPLAAGDIAAADEVLPYYVQHQFAFVPGVMGLFLGTLFNGALSFLVSNVNSLATVTWEDFVSAAPAFRGVDDRQQLCSIKIIGILYAVVICALSLCVGSVGGVVEGSQLVTSATSGALLGVFILAVACPAAERRGACAGMMAAHLLTAVLAVGRIVTLRKDDHMLPLHTDGCPNATLSSLTTLAPAPGSPLTLNHTLAQLAPLLREHPTHAPPAPSLPWMVLEYVFSISYMWYAVLGTCVCVLVGNAVGLCVRGASETYDERLLHPSAARLARRYPRLAARLRSAAAEEKHPPSPSPVADLDKPLPPALHSAVVSPSKVFTSVTLRDVVMPISAPQFIKNDAKPRGGGGGVAGDEAALSATASRHFDAYSDVRTRF